MRLRWRESLATAEYASEGDVLERGMNAVHGSGLTAPTVSFVDQ
jgi:hypothetical protein